MTKNLIVTVDFGKTPEWAINAKMKQLNAWLEANQETLPFDNLVVIPSPGESRLYWLEGQVGDTNDQTEIERIRDKMKPILEVGLGIKIDSEKQFVDPFKKAVADLALHRRSRMTK